MMVDDDVYGRMTVDQIDGILQKYISKHHESKKRKK